MHICNHSKEPLINPSFADLLDMNEESKKKKKNCFQLILVPPIICIDLIVVALSNDVA